MKQFLILFVLLSCLVLSSMAQGLYLRGGYNTQFSRPNGLNYVVERYNETRTFLTQEMKPFNNLNGVTYGILAIVDHFYMEAQYDHRSQKRTSIGLDANNQELARQLRASINSFGFGFGYGTTDDGYGIAFGTRINVGPLRVRTKVGTLDEINDLDWEEDDVHNQLHIDLDFNIKLILAYFIIEPYYTFQIIPEANNMAEVNEAINPMTFPNDPENIPFKSGGFGLKLMFAIGG